MKEREALPVDVVSPGYMGGTKKRKEMTPAWKQRVLAVLADNKVNGRAPSTLSALARDIKADKRGIYQTFETGQTSSSYVDAICALLKIDPPLQEAPLTDESKLRALDPEKQAALLAFINGLSEAIRSMPAEQQQPLRSLIAKFLSDFFSG